MENSGARRVVIDSGPGALQAAGGLLTFTLIVAILYFAQGVLIPVALAIMLAFVLNPVVALLQRARFGRVTAVLMTVCLTCLFMAGLIGLVGLQLSELANDLNNHDANIRSKIALLRRVSEDNPLNRIRLKLEELVQEPARDKVIATPPVKAPVVIQPTSVLPDRDVFTRLLGPLRAMGPALEIVGKMFLGMVLAICMLLKREDLRNRLLSFLIRGSLTTTTKALDDAGQRISRYMVTQLFINGVFGLAIGIGLFVVGVPYALLWGLCAGVLRYIPYVGAWIAAFAPLAVSFVTSSTWTGMIVVFILFLVLELIAGNVIEPWLYGNGTGVSEVALLISAAFWASLWGPAGLMLATPLTVCVVVAGKYVPALAFFDKLLGDRPALRSSAVLLQRLLARDIDEASAIAQEFCSRKSPQSIYDGLFIPALSRAMRDRASGAMPADDEQHVVRETVVLVQAMKPLRTEDATFEGRRIVGFPAHDEVDELTLLMLDQTVRTSGLQVEIFSTKTLPSENIAEVVANAPDIVFIAALPPGGLPQASYLCESLRESLPDLHIIVGYWGCEENLDEVIADLRSAGANYVATTVLGARSHIISALTGQPARAALESA